VNNPSALKQNNTTGLARTVNGAPARDQSLRVDITPTQFGSVYGWVGAIIRYQDDNNYYFVQLRDKNRLILGKLVNGVSTLLDSADLPVAVNNHYRLRLEAVGTKLRAYVWSELIAEADDSSIGEGRYGFATGNAAALFDTLVVTRP
jgi:hypothetical protein